MLRFGWTAGYVFHRMEKFGGNLFLREQKAIFEKKKGFVREKKFQFFAHKNISDKSQSFYQLTSNSHFHRTKDNVQVLFSSTICGVKHAPQIRFSAKSDYAFDESLRLAPVQSLKAVLEA